MNNDFFLKVLHEEPIDKVSLEAIKGGRFTCTCFGGATFNCNCYNTDQNTLSCVCFGEGTSYTCTGIGIKPVCPQNNINV